MTRRRHAMIHVASLIVVGLLLIAWLHERDARRQAEFNSLQFADIAHDMIAVELERVRAKIQQMETQP